MANFKLQGSHKYGVGYIDQGFEKQGAIIWDCKRDPLSIFWFVISLGAGKIHIKHQLGNKEGRETMGRWGGRIYYIMLDCPLPSHLVVHVHINECHGPSLHHQWIHITILLIIASQLCQRPCTQPLFISKMYNTCEPRHHMYVLVVPTIDPHHHSPTHVNQMC